jgi:CRP-like cAMP-binding protein
MDDRKSLSAGNSLLPEDKEVSAVHAYSVDGRFASVAAHPLAELLECPPETGKLLSGAAQCVAFQPGDAIFRQNEECRGLYVVVSGELLRKAERMNTRITLGPAHAGDLLELAAALGVNRHTYTLSALTAGSLLMLPMEALQQAFGRHPALRMRLLQELAREVSRAYTTCCMSRATPVRRRGNGSNQS